MQAAHAVQRLLVQAVAQKPWSPAVVEMSIVAPNPQTFGSSGRHWNRHGCGAACYSAEQAAAPCISLMARSPRAEPRKPAGSDAKVLAANSPKLMIDLPTLSSMMEDVQFVPASGRGYGRPETSGKRER